MQSQPLEAFLRFDPDPALTKKQQEEAGNRHLYTFAAAITGKASVHPELDNEHQLAELLLTAVSFKLSGSKKVPSSAQVAIDALVDPAQVSIATALLCNDHTSHYLSKAVRADYDNHFLRPPPKSQVRQGLTLDGIDAPTLLNLFHLQGAAFYSFYCTLFYYRGRLTSGIEAVLGQPFPDLQHALHNQLRAMGLQRFSEALEQQTQALTCRRHPELVQGKQVAFPLRPEAIHDQAYVVVTPAPAVSMIYAIDHAVDKSLRQGIRQFEKMRLGGANPINMGSSVLNLSRGSGPLAHNLRPLRAYVPPLSKRLYLSEHVLRQHSYEYASVMELDDTKLLEYLRTAIKSPAELKQWARLLPAALFKIMRPLADLRSSASPETLALSYRHEIEKDFVCKDLYEDLLKRAIDKHSYAMLARHVADQIEARLLPYKGFGAGLGVVRKKVIVRTAEMVGRKLL
ncbi:hypothetical protein RBE51_21530 [Pseudomonas taiwanensis]|uniref:hypothetical protein n=1 Tax=Pseudomonas taiwanensis TaxID=470150 RepID=UPI0028DFC62B|nr:hypothetical protein [Pseudomonas taiwanensis]MDT8925381.1 hypothetical protein [Pseudomonas taiwanensis]